MTLQHPPPKRFMVMPALEEHRRLGVDTHAKTTARRV
jgi:hypothetical protein